MVAVFDCRRAYDEASRRVSNIKGGKVPEYKIEYNRGQLNKAGWRTQGRGHVIVNEQGQRATSKVYYNYGQALKDLELLQTEKINRQSPAVLSLLASTKELLRLATYAWAQMDEDANEYYRVAQDVRETIAKIEAQ